MDTIVVYEISDEIQQVDFTGSFLIRYKMKNLIEKVEVVPPGFINIWLSDEALLELLKEKVLEQDD